MTGEGTTVENDPVIGEDIRLIAEPGRLQAMEFTVPASDVSRFPTGLALTITIDGTPWPMLVDDVWIVGERAAVKLVRNPDGVSPVAPQNGGQE